MLFTGILLDGFPRFRGLKDFDSNIPRATFPAA
jgi:hypothetical protein